MAKVFRAGTDDAVVQTKAGKLRGFYFDGVYAFHGIQYATAKRFEQPVPVEPWEGIKDAQAYGYVAPLMSPNSPNMNLLIPHRFWPESEDCLYLNVWSTELCDKAKKPVMVWLHGGGYAAGSSIEMIAYEGDNMAKKGDVVCVTINHRLNMLGYFDLSAFGEKFANSGNAGHADMVEALKWVHDNIANFGGDPENVTIFGQSGGGMKVQDLMQIPAADGLFHKGIIMSGGASRPFGGNFQRHDKEIADLLIEKLGGTDVTCLQEVPVDELFKAFNALSPELEAKGLSGGMMMWSPVPNDWYLGTAWNVGYTEHGKTIPIMGGSVIAEMGFRSNIENKNDIPEEEREKMIIDKYGEETGKALIEEFKKAFPRKNILNLLPMSNRAGAYDFFDMRVDAGCAPSYSYLFAYEFPYKGGMPAWHCSDIPFAFGNADVIAICNEDIASDNVQNDYFGAYMAFAHTGSPNGRGLKCWPAWDKETQPTMFFDDVSYVSYAGDKKLMELHEKVAENPFAAPRKQDDSEKITF